MELKNYGILNSKQIKEISREIKENWGCSFDGKDRYAYLINKKNNIYLINKALGEQDLSGMNIDSIGLYFGEQSRYGLRLSIEGSELICTSAVKNVVELDDDQMMLWLRGNDLILEESQLSICKPCRGFILLKHQSGKKTDFLGCGLIKKEEKGKEKIRAGKEENKESSKESKQEKIIIQNYVPKARRIMVKES